MTKSEEEISPCSSLLLLAPLFPALLNVLLSSSHILWVDRAELGWLTGARGKTLVREAELDREENSGLGGGSREEASGGSTRIEVWQDFLHASE
ncbi:hypothetical protein Taro_015738, partial [Colocasia esculenta]|nr:hypothetical protein [Colocasia esculenta]